MNTIAREPPGTVAHVDGAWWSPYVTRAGVAVSLVDLSPSPACEGEAFRWLDGSEKSSWHRYTPTPRRRFALCRAALRAILCRRLGCVNERLSFGASRYGKPFALVGGVRSPVSFNVSHSRSIGLVAVGDYGRLGVDIEEPVPQRNLALLIDGVMGPDERARLAALSGPDKLRLFYRIWTFKEALTKGLGTGLTTNVSQFQVPPDLLDGGRRSSLSFPNAAGITWALEDIGSENFAAALAYESPAYSHGDFPAACIDARGA